MKKRHRNELHFSKKDNSYNKRLILFGVASLIWFIFRTGTKPSRVVCPCQRAALANSARAKIRYSNGKLVSYWCTIREIEWKFHGKKQKIGITYGDIFSALDHFSEKYFRGNRSARYEPWKSIDRHPDSVFKPLIYIEKVEKF